MEKGLHSGSATTRSPAPHQMPCQGLTTTHPVVGRMTGVLSWELLLQHLQHKDFTTWLLQDNNRCEHTDDREGKFICMEAHDLKKKSRYMPLGALLDR